MAAAPDSPIPNLEPQTTREWLQYIDHRLNIITRSQYEDHGILISLNEKTDARLKELERSNDKNCEAIGTLKTRVNNWNVINSIGVVIAAILAAFGLKGS